MENLDKKNDYFTRKMFFRLLAPTLVSAIGLSIGDMADAIVMGLSLGVTGLAAVSLALPVFMIINIVMHGFGAGGSIIYAKLLGEGKKEQGVKSFNSVLQVAILIGVIMAVVGNIFLTPLLGLLGTKPADGVLFTTSAEYVKIISWGIPLFFVAYILNYYLRNDDSQKIANIGFTVGNVTDIVLNLVLVLGLNLGAAGAAYATLIGQVVAILFYLPCILKKKNTLEFKLEKADIKIAFRGFVIGFSSSVQYGFSLIFILIANNMLIKSSGDTGVAVFDIVQNLSFLTLYLYEGSAKAAQPLVSTFCGERNERGRIKAFELSVVSSTIIGVTATALIAIFPKFLCTVFGITDAQTMSLAIYAIRVFCIGATLEGISVILESYFQACEKEGKAFLIAALRGAVVLIPFTILFSTLGEKGFWFLFPATEIVSILAFLIYWKVSKKPDNHVEAQRIYTKTIESKSEDVAVLTSDIQQFCKRFAATDKQTYFVTMTVEEICVAIMAKLFTSTEYGYIQITVIALENADFELHIRDSAMTFNPFELHTKKVNTSDDYDMDAMGMLVIKNRAKDFFYRRYQGFNTLMVKI